MTCDEAPKAAVTTKMQIFFTEFGALRLQIWKPVYVPDRSGKIFCPFIFVSYTELDYISQTYQGRLSDIAQRCDGDHP